MSAPAQAGFVYYPSCVAGLHLRFDSAFQIRRPGSAPVLVVDESDAAAGGQDSAPSVGEPLFVTGASADGLSHILDRVPVRATVERPGYRQFTHDRNSARQIVDYFH